MRAVLISGTGGAFCAWADMKDFVYELDQGGPAGLSQHLEELAGALHRDVVLGIRRLEKPVIASIDGVAAGGGFSLMLACDIPITSEVITSTQ